MSVRPLKTKVEVRRFTAALRRISPRECALFAMGITWGLRIGDLLGLRLGDVLAGEGRRMRIVKELRLREQKTGKTSNVCVVTEDVRVALKEYLKTRGIGGLDMPLFLSRKKSVELLPRAVGRIQVYRVFKRAAREVDLPVEYVGTHTMRKTFGYGLLKNGVPLERIMKHLNHSSERETLRYLGVEEEQLISDKLLLRWDLSMGLRSQNRNGFLGETSAELPKSSSYPQSGVFAPQGAPGNPE